MKRTILTVACVLGLVAVVMGAIGTSQDDGMRGFFGRSNSIQGIVEVDHGTGTNQPGYIMLESCDGTAFWIFADNSGGLRGHTAVPTADANGVAMGYTDTIGTAHMADGDHGDFTYATGSATLDVNTVAAAELADGDLGDGTFTSGVFALDADVVAAAEMADADHGDGSWTSGVFSIDHDATYDVNSVTATVATLTDARYYIFNSSGGAITATLADGTTVGEVVILACKVAGNDIDVTVAHHVTSDPEVIKLDTAKEYAWLIWDATDWVEIDVNGVSYP